MIPSVQERKRNVHIFVKAYPQLCRLHNVVPNSCIKVDEANNILEFPGDRLKQDDWKPVIEAISNDRSLHYISIYNKYSNVNTLQENKKETKLKQTSTPKIPPLFTKSITNSLGVALSTCLRHSQTLTGLLLENIDLSCDSINKLLQGLEVSNSIQQLSLPYTRLGDEGCAGLCRILRQRLNLVWINLTGCNLTHLGIKSICNLLIFQKLNRYSESWKQSLRYRKVNPNIMPGLRRLTLSHNLIGDAGMEILVETLIDDLWVKALDLQNCNITTVGGDALLNLVKKNKYLSVVDIRGNKELPSSLVATIIQTVFNRNNDVEGDYPWLKADCLNSTCRSNMTISSGSMQKSKSGCIYSNTVPSVVPKKVRVVIPHAQSLSTCCTRLSKSKRIQNQKPSTPKPPWNWNNKTRPLRKEQSDSVIPSIKIDQKQVSEVYLLKQQLKKMAYILEEETKKRRKVEEELNKYKSGIAFCNNFKGAEDRFKEKFQYLYDSYLAMNQNVKVVNDNTSENSIESVITTLNRDNAHGPLGSTDKTDVINLKPHIIFETLLSS